MTLLLLPALRPCKPTTRTKAREHYAATVIPATMWHRKSPARGCQIMSFSEFRDFASELADAAAEAITPFFRSKLMVDQKADETPVTQADRAAEQAMRKLILQKYPHHEILGEEFGLHKAVHKEGQAENGYRWVLDPIDGTRAFITEGYKPLSLQDACLPRTATTMAAENGIPIVGVINQPISKERWIGVAGARTTLNGAEISCRACDHLAAAYLFATSPHQFPGGQEAAFARVRDQSKMALYGCDCYAYGLLALGFADLVVEATMQPYDYLALVPVIEGAGGVITDWQGAPLHWPMTPSGQYGVEAMPGEVIAAGDASMHEQALPLLADAG